MPTKILTLYFSFWANPIRVGLSKRLSLTIICDLILRLLLGVYFNIQNEINGTTRIKLFSTVKQALVDVLEMLIKIIDSKSPACELKSKYVNWISGGSTKLKIMSCKLQF